MKEDANALHRLPPCIGIRRSTEVNHSSHVMRNRLAEQNASPLNQTYTVDTTKAARDADFAFSDAPSSGTRSKSGRSLKHHRSRERSNERNMFNASYAAEDVEIGKGVEFSENREKDTLKEVIVLAGGCCSWSRICDVMGNRQSVFIEALRPLKEPVIDVCQKLITLQLELERGMRTVETTQSTSRAVHRIISLLNHLAANNLLNVPPDENEMMRQCALDLTLLKRIINELRMCDRRKSHDAADEEEKEEEVRISCESPPFSSRGVLLRNAAAGSSAVDEHSLKERINRNREMLEKFLKFIDKKTERRWWLKDVINFSQGVIEVLDQYFLRNAQPEDIKLHVITTISAASSKG